MRTPWRFVADLVSRRPKIDASNNRRAAEREIRVLGYKTPGVDDLSENDATEPVASADLVHKDEADANSETQDLIGKNVPVFREQLGPTVEVSDQVISEKSVVRRQEETSGKDGIAGNAVVSDRAEASVVAKTFIEEVAELDAEVEVLRQRLASKLREQNAQLRKMLSRFEAH